MPALPTLPVTAPSLANSPALKTLPAIVPLLVAVPPAMTASGAAVVARNDALPFTAMPAGRVTSALNTTSPAPLTVSTAGPVNALRKVAVLLGRDLGVGADMDRKVGVKCLAQRPGSGPSTGNGSKTTLAPARAGRAKALEAADTVEQVVESGDGMNSGIGAARGWGRFW